MNLFALSVGERKMLEHMKFYVMETKMAETELSVEERQIWEDMKREYLEMQMKGKPRSKD